MSLYELEGALIEVMRCASSMPELKDNDALLEFARLYLLGALISGRYNLKSIIIDLPEEAFSSTAPMLAVVADAILRHLGTGVPAAATAGVLSVAAR